MYCCFGFWQFQFSIRHTFSKVCFCVSFVVSFAQISASIFGHGLTHESTSEAMTTINNNSKSFFLRRLKCHRVQNSQFLPAAIFILLSNNATIKMKTFPTSKQNKNFSRNRNRWNILQQLVKQAFEQNNEAVGKKALPFQLRHGIVAWLNSLLYFHFQVHRLQRLETRQHPARRERPCQDQ